MNNLTLTIADTAIRTDAEGRFCLNDLHRAAGGESRHRPHYWLENQQTKELFAELAKAGNPAIETKQGLGTYVSKELVYAYAMWISPAFNLKVIRAYDALVTQPRVKFSRMDIIKLAMESEQRAMALSVSSAAGRSARSAAGSDTPSRWSRTRARCAPTATPTSKSRTPCFLSTRFACRGSPYGTGPSTTTARRDEQLDARIFREQDSRQGG